MASRIKRLTGIVPLAVALLMPAVSGQPISGRSLPLVFGTTPIVGVEQTRRRLQPLVEHLAHKIGQPMELEVAKSYGALIDAMVEGRIDIAKFSPLSYVRARRRTQNLQLLAVQVANGSLTYSSYIVSVASAGIKPLAQWREARLCFADPDSTSGYLMPTAYLLERGINPFEHFASVEFGGNHRACLDGLFDGRYDLVATFSGAIREARQAGKPVGELVIVAKAGRIPYDAWCVRSDLPVSIKNTLRQALLSTNTMNPLGRRVLAPTLGINGWVAADDSIYDNLRKVESM
ncbi:MAG: phosphate/phosphite/phosphonate ABC transporter substrate-binding protein, partial [Deltaproteobacteria bacterium]